MNRRQFVAGLVALPWARVALPETLPWRRAVFEEMKTRVVMTLAVPELVPAHDVEAVRAIDSGFDTTLRYELALYRAGARVALARAVHEVRIRRDPWTKRYVVARRTDDGWSKSYFTQARSAIASAVRLDRAPVGQVHGLERGREGPYYFVTVLALRNPIEHEAIARARVSGRGQGRDLEWFGRLVEVFAGERPLAEEVVHVRTNSFYLVAQ